MDKYESLLRDRSLYLARIDSFLQSDPCEGTLPDPAEVHLQTGAKRFPSYLTESIDRQLWTRQFYVSCWCMSVHESAGMWERYGSDEGAVCVMSTYERLSHISGDGQVHIGLISYVDYRLEDFRWWDEFAPVMHKRVEFAEEREVRILLGRVCSFLLATREQVVSRLNEKQPKGYRLPLSPESIVDEVRVSPTATEQFYSSVIEKTRENAPQLLGRIKWSTMRRTYSW